LQLWQEHERRVTVNSVRSWISYELLSCLSLFDRTISVSHFLEADSGRTSIEVDFFIDEIHYASAQAALEWCHAKGASVLYPGHADYPEAFLHLEMPPLFLSCWGRAVWKDHRCLSVVGSRDPSRAALSWMETYLMEFIRRTGAATVSGGARGIDQKAHALSLRAKRPTVIFLPSGLGNAYPPEIGYWNNEVLQTGGAILSPYAPLQDVRKSHFEGRNRLIAALGRLLFVVEARRRSGSLMTARLAREVDRTICALPSGPDEPRSMGTLDLLFDGGFPLRDADDLHSLFELSQPLPSVPIPQRQMFLRDRLAPSSLETEESGE
jgi:DNA processing protein